MSWSRRSSSTWRIMPMEPPRRTATRVYTSDVLGASKQAATLADRRHAIPLARQAGRSCASPRVAAINFIIRRVPEREWFEARSPTVTLACGGPQALPSPGQEDRAIPNEHRPLAVCPQLHKSRGLCRLRNRSPRQRRPGGTCRKGSKSCSKRREFLDAMNQGRNPKSGIPLEQRRRKRREGPSTMVEPERLLAARAAISTKIAALNAQPALAAPPGS
jgi:hypothetical protein